MITIDAGLAPVTFDVLGDPIPQGSMKLIGRRLISDNPRLDGWRRAVTLRAREAWYAHAGRRTPLYGPVHLDLVIAVRQRTSAPKSWRILPDWNAPISRGTGDADKIARGICDALTIAQVYRDDSQVVDLHVAQFYADANQCPLSEPGARITITEALR